MLRGPWKLAGYLGKKAGKTIEQAEKNTIPKENLNPTVLNPGGAMGRGVPTGSDPAVSPGHWLMANVASEGTGTSVPAGIHGLG